jgi:hypothetical protein
MAKSRNRSRDARKRAAKKRKNRDYQTRKLLSLAQKPAVEIAEENDGTRQQDS